jgi:NADPH2:quinone reductase
VRAVVVSRTGGPEVLEVQERPDPSPGPQELLVDVDAAGVNFIDIYQREGRYPLTLPYVAGSEGAGVVREVGDGVQDVAPGDRVAWAMVTGAGYASATVVPADRAVPVPEGVTTEQAAAVLLQGLTAHYLCRTTFPVSPGDDVVVHAAAGGVGLLLTQMVSAAGGRVIATVSTEQKESLARGAGAAEVVRYDREDVVERVRALTDGRGVAAVYDGVGQATFDASLECLAPRGMLVLFGAASGPVPPFDPLRLMGGGSLFLTRPTLTHYAAQRTELLERAGDVLSQVRDGHLDVRIGARYDLDEAGRAHEDLAGRRTTGKSLIVPGGA